jgi:hypothetical protein
MSREEGDQVHLFHQKVEESEAFETSKAYSCREELWESW